MQDKLFDETIKNALENIEVPFDPASWEMFEQRMQNAVQGNPDAVDPVDKVVSHALSEMEVPFEPAHWDEMSKRLNKEQAFQMRAYFIRLAKVAVFLLLVWNFGAVLFQGKHNPFSPSIPKYDNGVAENNPTKNTLRNRTNQSDHYNNNIVETSSTDFQTSPIAAIQEALGLGTGQGAENTLGQNAEVAHTLFAGIPTESDQQTGEQPIIIANTGRSVFGTFTHLPGLPLQHVEKSSEPLVFNAFTIKKHREKKFYISNYATASRNQISTPAEQDFNKESYAQWTNGYGGGIAIGTRRGKWGIETGASYTSKRYNPHKVVQTTYRDAAGQVVGVYLSENDLDVVSVPVHVNRQIAKAGRTSIRATAGISANAATRSAYRYKSIVLPPTAPMPGSGTPQTEPVSGKGVLEGGKWRDNAWMTADAGIRVEHKVNRQVTAFLEPSYSRALNGKIGPKNDRIGGLFLNAGVMASL